MKKLLPTFSKTYLKDSYVVLNDIRNLGQLPPYARLFTADAVSMYTNIDTKHALTTFEQWFATYPDEIPEDFPTEFFLKILKIVMTSNVFQFDDTYWHQLQGTAMGTSAACMYATLYYAYHERLTLLPFFSTKLLYFRRFIDDIIGIWWDARDELEWKVFQEALPFGSLQWETTKLCEQVVYLDLQITINNKTRKLETTTYQKQMNLFLYIPPHSAHPTGVLKSIIFSNLRRYWIQNTHRADYVTTAAAFANHLVRRGHTRDTIKQLFLDAANQIDKQQQRKQQQQQQQHVSRELTQQQQLQRPTPNNVAQPTTTLTTTATTTLYIHWEYHPRGVSRRDIRHIYNTTLSHPSGHSRMIVAYRRPRNLRDLLMPTSMREPPGRQASLIFPTTPGATPATPLP